MKKLGPALALRLMPTPFVADAADEAVRSNSILNERKATDIIEETALEVDIL